jgi:3,4-dihydroxy-2-butanone 4-phosphate synthase
MREGSKSNPHGRLMRALSAMAGDDSELLRSSSTRWASATFTGARHQAELRMTGEDAHEKANALAESLPEAEFALAGHIVADLTIEGLALEREGEEEVALLRIAALTVEDW